MFIWNLAKWNSLRCSFHFSQFDQNEISNQCEIFLNMFISLTSLQESILVPWAWYSYEVKTVTQSDRLLLRINLSLFRKPAYLGKHHTINTIPSFQTNNNKLDTNKGILILIVLIVNLEKKSSPKKNRKISPKLTLVGFSSTNL